MGAFINGVIRSCEINFFHFFQHPDQLHARRSHNGCEVDNVLLHTKMTRQEKFKFNFANCLSRLFHHKILQRELNKIARSVSRRSGGCKNYSNYSPEIRWS